MRGYMTKRILLALLAAYLFSFAVFFLTEWGTQKDGEIFTSIYPDICYFNHKFLGLPDFGTGVDALLELSEFPHLKCTPDPPFLMKAMYGHWLYLANHLQGNGGWPRYGLPFDLYAAKELLPKYLPPTLWLAVTAFALSVGMASALGLGTVMFPRFVAARLVGHRSLVILCALTCLAYLTWTPWVLSSLGRSSVEWYAIAHSVIGPAVAMALLALPSVARFLFSTLGAFLRPSAPADQSWSDRGRVAAYQALDLLTRSSLIPALASHLSWLLLGLLAVETFFGRSGIARLLVLSIRNENLYELEPLLLVIGILIILGWLITDILRRWTEHSAWFQAYRDLAERTASGKLGGWAVRR